MDHGRDPNRLLARGAGVHVAHPQSWVPLGASKMARWGLWWALMPGEAGSREAEGPP